MKDEKPTIQNVFNFHAPVGQNIAHVDTLNVTFDKDMKMQVIDLDSIADSSSEDEVKTTSPQSQNFIFRTRINGKTINLATVRRVVEDVVVKHIKYKYEWFAVYRIMYDMKILEELQLSRFAEQMQAWFPEATVPCTADSLGDYATGHTVKAFSLWNLTAFCNDHTKAQSTRGFNRLYCCCTELQDAMRIVLNA